MFWVATHPTFPDSISLSPLVCDRRRIPITYLEWSVNKGPGPFWVLVCHLCRSYKSHPSMDTTEAAGVQMPSHHQSTSPSLSVCTLGTGVGILTPWGNVKKGVQRETLTRQGQYLNRDPSLMTNVQGGHQAWGYQSINGLSTLQHMQIMLSMVPDLTASLEFSSWNKCLWAEYKVALCLSGAWLRFLTFW